MRTIDSIVKFFTSLKLTVVCLAMALVLVFIGTIAQVKLGLYLAQENYFQSLFVYWSPKGADWRLPVWPGGYLLGGVLLINLIAAHIQRFKPSRSKIGIFMTHAGLILLLVGQFLTETLSVESHMRLEEGQAKNYSESDRHAELAFTEIRPDAGNNLTVSIPQYRLEKKKTVQTAELPFDVTVTKFYPNSRVQGRGPASTAPVVAEQGFGPMSEIAEVPATVKMDERNLPSAVVELTAGGESLGTWLASIFFDKPQIVQYDGKRYEMTMRWVRHYKPYYIKLLDFTHERYPGTEIPKDFSSRVQLIRPDTGENREIKIYMNNPLRYGGETYYQSGFEPGDTVSILQVVRNPAWLTPYFSVTIIGLGLTVQFLYHLFAFARRRTA